MSTDSTKPFSLSSLGGLPVVAVLASLVVLGTVAGTTGVLAAKATVNPPTISSGPVAGSAVTATDATFAFTDSPAGMTFQCQLDNLPLGTCSSPKAYSGLAEGSHTFQVRAVSGGDQSTFTSRTWSVDLTPPPSPTFTAKPAALSNTTSTAFGFADTEAGVSFQCKLDTAGSFTACSNPQSYSGLAQGSHSLSVKSVDAAGNVSAAPATYGWNVDTVAPPTPVITQKPNDPAVGATQSFAFIDSEVGVSFQCAGENGVFGACASPYTYVVDTGNTGQHQFAVRALDAAGNGSSEASYKFKVAKDIATSGTPFVLSGSVSGLVLGVWKALPVHVPNPNSVPIYVTALTVSVSANSTPAGCLSGSNIELLQSNISTSLRLTVPANGSVDLPAQGVTAPQIRLKDLPTNQDNCKGKTFTITYSATANN